MVMGTRSSFPACGGAAGGPASPRVRFLPLLHHRRCRTLFPHPVLPMGKKHVVTHSGTKITSDKVQYLFSSHKLRGSCEITYINNWL